MTVIGLTGSLGTGKTTVAAMFKDLGAAVIDADGIARSLIEHHRGCRQRIKKEFPEAVSGNDIDRQKLAGSVFKDEEMLKRLEEILHPQVRRQIKDQLKQLKEAKKIKAVVLDIPLLFEAGFEDLADAVVVVRANQKQMIERVAGQRRLTRQDIVKRLRRQMPQQQKIKLADFIIDNRSSKAKTRAQVKAIWEGLVNV